MVPIKIGLTILLKEKVHHFLCATKPSSRTKYDICVDFTAVELQMGTCTVTHATCKTYQHASEVFSQVKGTYPNSQGTKEI